MNDHDLLAERFEQQRPQLQAMAFRMLGAAGEADDAVQEAWLRLSRSDASAIENLGGWLRTVVARICLDLLRARAARHEDSLEARPVEPPGAPDPTGDPERQALLADAVGMALLVVLDRLAPAERVAFVLHDIFAVPFEEIAPIVDRSHEATRQLASRARRRVRGASGAEAANRERQRALVEAFLDAAREGNFDALLRLLDPAVVLRADRVAVAAAAANADRGAPLLAAEVHGAAAVATAFSGRAQVVQPALIDGHMGAAWAMDGQPRSVFRFTITDGAIAGIEIVYDPKHIRQLEVVLLD